MNNPDTAASAASAASADLQARIESLVVYPIKSCGGIALQQTRLTSTGLPYDRAWMLVDQNNQFVSQRELPRMALIAPQMAHLLTPEMVPQTAPQSMVVQAPGMPVLQVPLPLAAGATSAPLDVEIWGDQVKAFDLGPTVAQWFSDYLLTGPAAAAAAKAGIASLRLVRFDMSKPRLSNKEWTGGVEAPNQFSDGYPVLVLSQASLSQLNDKLAAAGRSTVAMARFRPNVVLSGLQPHEEDQLDLLWSAEESSANGGALLRMVKPCPRCPIPNIDPLTANSSPEVSDTMQGYRQNPLLKGAVTFGINAITLAPHDQHLRVGQVLSASYRF